MIVTVALIAGIGLVVGLCGAVALLAQLQVVRASIDTASALFRARAAYDAGTRI